MGKGIEGEEEKKTKLGENITFDSTKSSKLVSKTQFNTIQTLTTLFYWSMGKKIIDFKTQRNMLRRR